MIGLLMLVGVVVTNAIVLIDLVNQYRRQGMSLGEGLMAGAQKRLRPILMTSAATIFALIPMALGVTGNSGFIAQPLAVVVIGGLITSTLLTLVIVPVLYRIAEGPGERRRIREEELAERRRRAREEAAAERARQEQAELAAGQPEASPRSEEHTSGLQSRGQLVCRLLLDKKKNSCKLARYTVDKCRWYNRVGYIKRHGFGSH